MNCSFCEGPLQSVVDEPPVYWCPRCGALRCMGLVSVSEYAEALPDMLEACKVQVANIERWLETGVPANPEESRSIYEGMKAAIAKAEGGSVL